MCSHKSPLLLLLFPLDYLIKHTEENTVLRRQDGAATGLGALVGALAYGHTLRAHTSSPCLWWQST